MEPSVFVAKLKQSDKYKIFKSILPRKSKNEGKAKLILQNNLGRLNHSHIREIIGLVDECYAPEASHVQPGPWFGRLFKPNARILLETDCALINKWFNLLVNEHIPLPDRIDKLRKPPYSIKGLSIGVITLTLYLLDNSRYLFWLKEHHDGLSLLVPELAKFNGKGYQYNLFNECAIIFAKQYSFNHVELDYVFSGIKYNMKENTKQQE